MLLQSRKYDWKALPVRLIEYIGLAALAAVFVVPFLWMLSTSLKTYEQSMQFPPALIPTPVVWENFPYVWEQYNLLGYLKNSVLVVVIIMVFQILLVVPTAYAFATKEFKGKALFFSLIIFGFMVPTEVTFVPVYLLFSKVGFINAYMALTIPFFFSAFGTFLFAQTFRQIPKELLESASLDGASEATKIFRIMLPMAKSTFVSFLLFSLVAHWNDYFWTMVMTYTPDVRTIPCAVANILNSGEMKNWSHIMAANVIMMLPMLVAYCLSNKHIKTALAYGGIK